MPVSDDDSDDLVTHARARVGTTLGGKYRIDRLLGVGGMASVFVATHLRNANRVAVKVLHRDLAREKEIRKRFLREGYAANSVDHAGTVRVLDDDTSEDGSPFLVMELLEGETLDARWERNNGRLGAGEVVSLMCDLLEVLGAAHAKGIVHRDIKPENLFVTRDSELKVLDFGIARLHKAPGSPTATGQGAVFGTPAFMPPEQALGHSDQIDALSDLWAVGATAFTLLSGRFVHEGTTSAETIAFAATRPAPSLGSVAPWIPAPVARVVDRALALRREDRWPSAAAMREAFLEARTGGEPRTTSEADDLTKVAPPPETTEALHRARDLPPPPGGSTVAGVVSSSQAGRTRSRQRMVLGAAAAGGLAVVLLVGAAITSLRSASPASGGPSSPSVSAALAASAQTLPAAPTPSNAPVPVEQGSTPWVPVEALPKANPGATVSAAPRMPSAPTPRPRANPPQPTPPAAPPAAAPAPPPQPSPPPKRDPLAPPL